MSLPDSDVIGTVADVAKSIVVILAVIKVRVQVAVVNPNVSGSVNANCVLSVFLLDKSDLQVLDDHVLDLLDQDPGTDDVGVGVFAEDGLVAASADGGSALESALNVDDASFVTLDGLDELVNGSDGDFLAACATSGTAVFACKTKGAATAAGANVVAGGCRRRGRRGGDARRVGRSGRRGLENGGSGRASRGAGSGRASQTCFGICSAEKTVSTSQVLGSS